MEHCRCGECPHAEYQYGTDGVFAKHSLEMALANWSGGKAQVEPCMRVPAMERYCVVVWVPASDKIIAVCGDAGAVDENESIANAVVIANDWNARRKERATCSST